MRNDSAVQLPSSKSYISARSLSPLLVATIFTVMIGCAMRVTRGNPPLWLDETFTGAIAAEPSLRAVLYQILQDINAPLYYLIAHYWSLIFGLSNEALRFPALIFALLAPFLCLVPAPGISRRVGLVWCAMTALWAPGILQAQEARGYSLLLCLSIGGTLALVKLLDGPTTKRAAIWALLASAAILTHYDALVSVGFQGIAYLILCGRKALRTWPAVFVFAPTFIWLAIHAPRIAELANPELAWYPLLQVGDLIHVLGFIPGSVVGVITLALFALIAAIHVVVGRLATETSLQEKLGMAEAVVGIACIGATVFVAIGFVRPSFADRYMVPFIPGLLLGLAIAAERLRRFWRGAPVALILTFIPTAFLWVFHGPPGWKDCNFEVASRALMESDTRKLVFLWDHPANIAEEPSQLRIVGGFFFRRAGIDVEVKPIQLKPGEDPNIRLLAAAKEPFSSILWLYDLKLHNTAATSYPPQISTLDRAWTCHDFGVEPIGIVACRKVPT